MKLLYVFKERATSGSAIFTIQPGIHTSLL